MTRICHISTVHPRYDIRIFEKECRALVNAGYEVTYIVADEFLNEIKLGVKIESIGVFNNRALRMLFGPIKLFLRTIKTKFVCFHIHDPELLPLAVLLRLQGKKVIFDAHESTSNQILNKGYIPHFLRKAVAYSFSCFQKCALPWLSGTISATETIDKEFGEAVSKREVIKNFPILPKKVCNNPDFRNRNYICYVGAITRDRCAVAITEAMQIIESEITLIMMGRIEPPELRDEIQRLDKKKRVYLLPHSSRDKVEEIVSGAAIGICLMKPTPAYIESQPTKLFEYMAHGIPVICSNFGNWKSLIVHGKSGLDCDPLNNQDIAKRIDYLITNPEKAKNYGKRGMSKVKKYYSWENEKIKLIEFYEKVLLD